ncbi:MAG: GTPase ObgE, partial [Roseomonas sp.]|nr:GTPase ObgE [Roseomonas sp.]
RCAVLLHLVDGTAADPAKAYRIIREELAGYGGGLAEKPEIVALNKSDAMTAQATTSRLKALSRAAGKPALLVSGATGDGVAAVLKALYAEILANRQR